MKTPHIEKIDLNLLVVLQTIYAEGSVTRAAVRLNVTQSALSHSLKRLREVLDDPLFLRSGSALVATPFTRNLMGPLEVALRNLQGALSSAKRFDPTTAVRRFVVGMDDRLEVFALPSIVQQVIEGGSGIEFHSIRLEQAHLEQSLLNGQVDAAISAVPLVDASLRRCLVAQDSLVVLARKNHPVMNGHALGLSQYLRCDHIAVVGDRSFPTNEDTVLARAGHARRIRFQTQRYVGAMVIVASSDLLVTMPKFFALVVNRQTQNNMFDFPVATDPVEFYLYWNSQMDDDAGIQWLRAVIARSLSGPGISDAYYGAA